MSEKEARKTIPNAGAECGRRSAVMPFGKFAGTAVALVYEREPGYLAWFYETVDGREEVKEAIRALDGIETHLAAYRQRRQPLPKRLTPSQQEVERLMERFAVDTVCEGLFGEEW
jgi:hypothetical protein